MCQTKSWLMVKADAAAALPSTWVSKEEHHVPSPQLKWPVCGRQAEIARRSMEKTTGSKERICFVRARYISCSLVLCLLVYGSFLALGRLVGSERCEPKREKYDEFSRRRFQAAWIEEPSNIIPAEHSGSPSERNLLQWAWGVMKRYVGGFLERSKRPNAIPKLSCVAFPDSTVHWNLRSSRSNPSAGWGVASCDQCEESSQHVGWSAFISPALCELLIIGPDCQETRKKPDGMCPFGVQGALLMWMFTISLFDQSWAWASV